MSEAPSLEAASELESEPSTRKPTRAIVLSVLGLAALAGGALYWQHAGGRESTNDAQVEADLVPLASRVGGQVQQLFVSNDQPVKKGDKLLQLDSTDFEARVAQAQAELDTAQAQADAADAQATISEAGAKGGFSSARAAVSGASVAVANADAQIASAEASLRRAQVDARRAEQDLKRVSQLRTADAVPQERLENTQGSFDAAQAAVAQAQAQLLAAQEGRRAAVSRVGEAQGRFESSTEVSAQISAARAQATLAHARVRSATAALTLARSQLAYTTIVAPADGFVSSLAVHEGQLVQPGQALAELVPNQAFVVANFKETQTGRMKPGQAVEVELDAYPGRKFEGKVTSISSATGARFSLLPPDNASGNYVKVVQRLPVRIALANLPTDVALRAGLSAEVSVRVQQ